MVHLHLSVVYSVLSIPDIDSVLWYTCTCLWYIVYIVYLTVIVYCGTPAPVCGIYRASFFLAPPPNLTMSQAHNKFLYLENFRGGQKKRHPVVYIVYLTVTVYCGTPAPVCGRVTGTEYQRLSEEEQRGEHPTWVCPGVGSAL